MAQGDASLLSLGGECARSQILVVMPGCEEGREFSRGLSDAGYAVAVACTACEAVECVEQQPIDGVVLDLDAFYEAGSKQAMISGFRLLELLWRAARARPAALVVLTALDYAEIDGVLRGRVDVLLSRPIAAGQVVARLEAALGRVARRRQSGPLALAASPLPAVQAE